MGAPIFKKIVIPIKMVRMTKTITANDNEDGCLLICLPVRGLNDFYICIKIMHIAHSMRVIAVMVCRCVQGFI